MKIGYIHNFDTGSITSGGAVHAYNLTREWVKMGLEIHALSPETNPGCTVHPRDEHGVKRLVNKVDILYIRIDGSPLRYSPFRKRAMLHATNRGVPIVWEINAHEREKLIKARQRRPPREERRKWAWFKRLRKTLGYWNLLRVVYQDLVLERRVRKQWAKSVGAATCVSKALLPYAAQLDIPAVTVVPNGSSPELFSPDRVTPGVLSHGEEPSLKAIFIGDISYPWQAYKTIVEVARRAWRDELPASFHILSHTHPSSESYPPNLYFEARVPYSQIASFAGDADVCFCLYEQNGWGRYGFHNSPLKLFDYMALGKPIIASDMGQISEVITDGTEGFLTDGSVEDVYQKLVQCVNQPSQVKHMGAAARNKLVQAYTWRHTAERTLKVFQAL